MRHNIHTTNASIDDTKQIADIARQQVLHRIKNTDTNYGKVGLLVESDLAPYTFPLIGTLNNEPSVVVDVRQYIGKQKTVDLQKEILKAYLMLQGEDEKIYRMYKYEYRIAGVAYAMLLSSMIARNYGLDIAQTEMLAAVFADFWGHLLREEDEDTPTRIKNIRMFSRASESLANTVVASKLKMDDLAELLESISKTSISPKLRRLDLSIVLNMSQSIAYGSNIKPTIAASLEYPPLFLWMVVSALSSLSYKNSYLTKVVMSAAKRPQANITDFTSESKKLLKIAQDIVPRS